MPDLLSGFGPSLSRPKPRPEKAKEEPAARKVPATILAQLLARSNSTPDSAFLPDPSRPANQSFVFDGDQTGIKIDPASKRQFLAGMANRDLAALGADRADQGVSGADGSAPSNWQMYKQAGRSQQMAMNAGAQSAYRPGMQDVSPRPGSVLPNQVAEMPAWNGAGNPENTKRQLAYAATIKNLQANKSASAKAADVAGRMRKDRFIANNALGLQPSDRSRETGLDRMLLAELLKQGKSPVDATAAVGQANGPNGAAGLGGMTPQMQALWMFRNPEAASHVLGQKQDLEGLAKLKEVQLKEAQLKEHPELATGKTPEQMAADKGKTDALAGTLTPEAIKHLHEVANAANVTTGPEWTPDWARFGATREQSIKKHLGDAGYKLSEPDFRRWYDLWRAS